MLHHNTKLWLYIAEQLYIHGSNCMPATDNCMHAWVPYSYWLVYNVYL